MADSPSPPVLVSSDNSGTPLTGRAGLSSISGDGNLVTFTELTNEGTGNDTYTAYLKNLTTGVLTDIGASFADSQSSRISPDGSNIVFEEDPTNFFSQFSSPPVQVYVYNVATATATLITRSTSGTQSDGSVFTGPSISDGGSVVSFDSNANDLVTGFTFSGNPQSEQSNVYINTGGVITLVSQINGKLFNDNSWNSTVSEDGTHVVFESFASNIGLGANGHEDEVYEYTIATKKLTLVSKTKAGVIANGDDTGAPVVSSDGRYVAFISAATNLAPGVNGKEQIYWKDTQTGVLKLVSCSAAGTPGNGIAPYFTPQGLNLVGISADGRFVTFASNSTNLVPGFGTNTSGTDHNVVYIKDMVTGDIDAVSQNTVDSTYSSISADGGFISYTNNNTGTESGAGAEGQIYVQHNPLPGDLTLKFGQPTLYEGTNDTITITLAIPAATDQTIDLTVTPDTVPQQDIVGIPTSATIKAGQTKVTIPFKLEQDPLASTTSETFSVSATSSVGNFNLSGAVQDFDSKPFAFVLDGGEFTYNSATKQMEATGNIDLEVTSGGTSWTDVTFENAKASYNATQFTVSGTVMEDLTGDDNELMQGTLTLPYNSFSTAKLTDKGPFKGKFDLGGLPITITQLTFEQGDVLAGFALSLPFTNAAISIDSFKISPNFGLKFDNTGASIVGGASVTFPDSGPVNAFGLFTGSVTGASIAYEASNDILKLQGTFSASKIFGFSATATVDLSGNNFIQYQNGNTDFVGSLKMTEDVTPGTPFAFSEIDASVDTIKKTFSGTVAFVWSWGAQAPTGSVTLAGSWGTGPTINEVDVAFSNASILIPDTPDTVWTGASLGVKDMFVDNAPITFSGSLSFAFGPQISSQYIASVTFNGSGSTQKLTAGYDLSMVPFNLANSLGSTFGLGNLSDYQSLFPLISSKGSVTADFAKGAFQDIIFNGTTSVLGGFITTTQEITANQYLDFTASGQAQVNFGNAVFKKYLAESLQVKETADFLASFTDAGPLSGDYAEAWFTLPVNVGVGSVTFTLGAKITLDGSVTILYQAPSDNSGQSSVHGALAAVAADSPGPASAAGSSSTYLFVTDSWTNSATAPVTLTVTSNGTAIDESNFAANGIAVVSGLVTPFSETVVIQNPGSATWSIASASDGVDDLGTQTVTSALAATAPSISSFTAASVNPDGTLTVDYGIANAAGATLTFYADRDGQNFDGVLLGTLSGLSDGSGTTSVGLASLTGGFWHVYAVISDGADLPQEVYASKGVLINAGGSGAEIFTPVVVSGGHTLSISKGQSSAGIEVQSGGVLKVLNGGTSFAATVYSGGSEQVSAGGIDLNAQVLSGGVEVVSGAGSGAEVQGILSVGPGGFVSSTTIDSGGRVVEFGKAAGTVVGNGGTQAVQKGALDSGASLYDGALQLVSGQAISTTIGSGAESDVEKGGVSLDAAISGTQLVFGTASAAVVSTGGSQIVESGGSAHATTLSGGSEVVSAGGVDSAAQISGGTQLDYGLAHGDTIFAGSQVVESAGTASATTVSGGTELVSALGIDRGATIRLGTELVYGTASGATVTSAGTQLAESDGVVSNTTLSAGGQLHVSSGGTADAVRILAGASDVVSSGGTDVGALVSSGGTQLAYGSSVGAKVFAGGVQIVESGGTASGTVVSSGGTLQLLGGSTVIGAHFSAGAIERFVSGSTAGGSVSGSGPVIVIGPGGIGSALTVSSGGKLVVLSGGVDSGAIILKGGTEIVSNGGVVSSATVSSGGNLTVLSGGTAIDVTVSSGGVAVTSSGGIVDVVSGTSDFGSLTNAGAVNVSDNATLTVSAASLGNVGAINLSGVGVNIGATLVLEESLTLTGGGKVSLGGSGGVEITAFDGVTLTNVNNSIAGAGAIGNGTGTRTLVNSGTINANTSGGDLILEATSTTNRGLMEATSSGTLALSGTVTNSGTIIAGAVGTEVEVMTGAVVGGGSAIQVANGLVDVQTGGTAHVAFASSGSGGLDLDGTGAIAVVVSGFAVSGGVAHKDHAEYIDFTAISSSGASISYTSANSSNTSGTLVVSSGGVSASVTLIGAYTLANFSAGTGIGGSLKITDPAKLVGGSVTGPSAALPQFWFDAGAMTLGYAGTNSPAGDTLTVSNGGVAINVGLLGNYIAASFAAGGIVGGVGVSSTNEPPLLVHPQHT
jgi:autotransporter passenger strand-loop-strand repeat protein